jgi:hypothetical protein
MTTEIKKELCNCGKYAGFHEISLHFEDRLAYLRAEIDAERISYGEIMELQSLAKHIDPKDTILLEWAGVPENQEFNATHTLKEIKEARQAVIDSN